MRVPSPTSISRLPSSQALRGPSGEGGTPEAFGASVGRSLMGAAQSTMALGTFVQEQEEKKSRFLALRNFGQFQTETQLQIAELKRTYNPSSMNYYEAAQQLYKQREATFLGGVPAELRDEFAARAADFGGNLALDSAKFQYESNDTFFKQGVQDALDEARITIGQDGSKETLERERARLDEVLDATGLSEAEKIAIRRKVYAGIEGVAYRQAQIQRLRDEQSGVGTDIDQAASLLDTFHALTPEEAAIAAQEGLATAVAAVGSIDTWAAMPSRVRAVLISLAAEQGGLSNDVVVAAQSGDIEALAEALRESGSNVGQTGGDLILNPEAGIDDDPAFSNLPYEDRLALLADAEREVAAEISAEKAASKAQKESLVNALHVAIMDGDAGQADIDQLREIGVLTDYDDITRANKILADRDEELRMKALGQQMLEGSITFAPGNKDHEDALNAVIGKEGLEAVEKMDSEYAANTLIPTIRSSGAVPTDVVDLVRGMIRSQDPNKAYWALDLMSQIERASPKGYLQFNDTDRNSVDFWQARRDYLPQEEVLKGVRGPVDPSEANARTALRREGEKLFTAENGPLKDFDPVSLFTAPGGGWFGLPGAAEAPTTRWVGEQLNQDFQTLFLDNYERSADVEFAKQAAQKQLQRVWGVTNTGADRKLMKYPPEMIYPAVRESHDWMEMQLRRTGLLADNEQFELITDTQTENEWGSGTAPSYLFAKLVDGRTEIPLDADGLPLRVNFDYGAEEAMDEALWRAEQNVAHQQADMKDQIEAAAKHALDTGSPIPGEFFEQFGGMLEELLNPVEAQ